MDKIIFTVCVCFFIILNASNCVKTEEYHTNSRSHVDSYRIEKVHRVQKRAVDISTTTILPSSNNNSNSSSKSSDSNSQSNVNLSQQQQPVGVNGTGQRKNYTSTSTQAPLLAETITQSIGKQYQDQSPLEFPDDGISLDAVDQPDSDVNKTLQNNNITKIDEDYHIYYKSRVYLNKTATEKHWNELGNLTASSLLSKSHRRAMTIQLSFDFPFYGHPVRNVTVATGGFLYTGEHVHSWLAATQYIAPLMANFDTSISNDSLVKYHDNGTAFTVLWEKVKLQDKDVGTFTFSATLYATGDIIFAYYSVPIQIESIQDDKHPVKVGLSDAYIIDKTIFFARRKTIYEYHRVNFANEDILNNTIIHLEALPTCLSFKDCKSCTTAKFDDLTCSWCPTINRCSTGTDRKRQEWLHKSCDSQKVKKPEECAAIGTKGNDYQSSTTSHTASVDEKSTTPSSHIEKSSTVPQSSRINDRKMNLDDHDLPPSSEHRSVEHHTDDNGVGTALGFIIPIGIILGAVFWVFYAYRNPHTKSGQLLIQYRPSQWSWRRGEARYTAATIHM